MEAKVGLLGGDNALLDAAGGGDQASGYLNQPGRTHAVTCVKLIGDDVPLYDALGRDANGRLTQAMLQYKRYSGKDKPQFNDLCPPGYARLDAKFRKGQPVGQIAVGPRQFVFHRGGLGYSRRGHGPVRLHRDEQAGPQDGSRRRRGPRQEGEGLLPT